MVDRQRYFAQMNQMKMILRDVMYRAVADLTKGLFWEIAPPVRGVEQLAAIAKRSQFDRAREGLGPRSIKANQGESR